jgi:lipid II:glycine glycyltransferase (peptidoglycan interpeptide bridge formation enzyme)
MHFLQSQIWKESKRNLGNAIFDVDQYFFHTTKLPIVKKTIGYMPRPNLRSINWEEFYKKGVDSKAIYITIDPENLKTEIPNSVEYIQKKLAEIDPSLKIKHGKPVHLQENLLIDLSKPSEELLAQMKQKHRYNLKLAAKKGVEVDISDSDDAFKEFINLYQETVNRKEYNGRSAEYIYTVWQTIKEFKNKLHESQSQEKIDVQIATAYYQNQPLASWMLFIYNDTIYYPYGGSSSENKNIMAPYALLWGIVEWGKSQGYKWFDTWGIKKNPNNDSTSEGFTELEYDGYSRFKVGFGGEKVEYADTVDVVFEPLVYSALKLAQRIRR